MSSPKNSDICNAGQFKRLKYFNGMLLTERDFCEEQDYLREKHKLNNRLHGAGVAWGLGLKPGCITVDKAELVKVFIAAGLALDCAGNEIIVCKDYLVPLDEKIAELRTLGLVREVQKIDLTDPTGKKTITEYVRPKLFIGIRYCECDSQPAEQFTSECGEDDLQPQFSRVREGFDVLILTEDEYHGCVPSSINRNGKTTDCGCAGLLPCTEEEQIVWLGCVEKYAISDVPLPLITNFDNELSRVQIPDSNWAYKSWDRQKLSMLASLFRDEKGWVDLSRLVGRSVAYFKDAEKFKKELILTPGAIYKLTHIVDLKYILARAHEALPWVEQDLNTKIDIVTDANERCIIFPFVQKR